MGKLDRRDRLRDAIDLPRERIPNATLPIDVVRQDELPLLVMRPGAERDNAFIMTVPHLPAANDSSAQSTIASPNRITITVFGIREWLSNGHIPPTGTLQFYVPRLDADNEEPVELGSAHGDVHLDDPIINVLANLLALYQHDLQRDSPRLYEKLLITLLRHVNSRYSSRQRNRRSRSGGLTTWQMRAVRELVNSKIAEDISLAEIAKACKLSTCHFARAFRRTTGRPPHRWVAEQRIHRAKIYLKETALPLSEVALRCGFNDQSHFTRVFSGIVGTSPGRWRKDA